MDSNVHVQREKNPREKASWFSVLFCLFGFKIFKKGFQRDLQDRDIYDVVDDFSAGKIGTRLEEEWKREKLRENPRLAWPLCRMFWKEFLILGVSIMIVETGNMMVAPILTGRLVSYFTPNQTSMTFNDAMICTFQLIGTNLGVILYMHLYQLYMWEMGLKIKIAMCTLIYRKSLRLTASSLSQCGNGFIVTLITKDILQFDYVIDYLIMLIEGVFQYSIMTYMIYREIGVAGILGASVIFLALPLQGIRAMLYLRAVVISFRGFDWWINIVKFVIYNVLLGAKFYEVKRVYMGKKTADYRYKTVIKTDSRVKITQEILTAMKIIKMYTWEPFFANTVSLLRKQEIRNLRILFYIKAIALSIGQLSSRLALYICIVSYVSFGNHITAEKAFIVTGCFAALRWVLIIFMPSAIAQLSQLRISIRRITNYLFLDEAAENSDYTEEKDPKVVLKNVGVTLGEKIVLLKEISLELNPGLTLVTGPVGSGKSNLLKLLLGDFKSEGSMEVAGRISYASQEPWIFPGTIKQNIIFGQWFDQKRYENVVRACALKQDFETLPNGDRTYLADRGLNLSRGQKTRINLARAVYRVADIYLLDDCLSAVDARVGTHIFKECIKGFLKDSICVLVTHHKQYLRQADKIVVLNSGSIDFQGSYAAFKDWGNEDIKSALQEHERVTTEEKMAEEKVANNIDTTEESALLDASSKTSRNIYEETKQEGGVAKEVYYKYFKLGGGLKIAVVVIVIAVCAQISTSWSDYFVSDWVDMEQEMSGFRYNKTTTSTAYKNLEESYASVMKLYSFVILSTAVFTLARTFSFLIFSSRASNCVHKLMLERILNAGMVFFDSHLSGNIINRLSRDLNIIDEQLPFNGLDILITILTLFGTLFVVSSINLYFIVPSIIFVTVLYFARYLYLPTGRSIKRLEGATRSPVVGHLNATLEGLTTIRASQMENTIRNEFDYHQNIFNSVMHMNLAASRAFGLACDAISCIYTAVITFAFVLMKDDTLAGKVGLALTQSFNITGIVQGGIKQWTDLETLMTSAERVLEYTEIESEDKSGKKINEWPKGGKIEYQEVNLRYSLTSERVLKDITFVIHPKEKIGLVGRTGAGKSSIISTLFRMYDYNGTIAIDDVNTQEVDVELLRSKISIIPQDPVLFSGTIRSNLDPNGEHPDTALWEALEEVEMKKTVGSLNTTITDGDSTFSIGQKQLLSLARAIIRNNIILVLDEATANIDPHTDSLIQRTIRRKFGDCTVITIAHRLHTVMDSDKVLVMDSGVAVEYGHPKILIQKRGLFYNMVKEAGLL